MVPATLADVRTLMEHLPVDRRERRTWRQVTADIEAAAAGVDKEGAAIGLRMVLFLERVESGRSSSSSAHRAPNISAPNFAKSI
jgi:hypothetical protein